MRKKFRQHVHSNAQSALSDAEIHARREAVVRERREREQALIEEEQRKYGLKRPGKPISEMPA